VLPQPHLTTTELAELLRIRPASIRRHLCVHGDYCGLRPVKLPNRMLRWPRDAAEALLAPPARKSRGAA
jgi:hypothetical protein